MKRPKYLKEIGVKPFYMQNYSEETKQERKTRKQNAKEYGIDDREASALRESSIVHMYVSVRRMMEMNKGLMDVYKKYDITIEDETKSIYDWLTFIKDSTESYLIRNDEYDFIHCSSNASDVEIRENVEKTFAVFGKICFKLIS